MFVLGFLGVIFAVYNYFRNPQISADKTDALLSQQIKWMMEQNESRFSNVQDRFNSLLLQSNNHIHTVDTKVEALVTTVTTMGLAIAKLGTIIEERVPRINPVNQ